MQGVCLRQNGFPLFLDKKWSKTEHFCELMNSINKRYTTMNKSRLAPDFGKIRQTVIEII